MQLFVWALVCVWERVQKTKQEQREKKERDCRKRVTLSKATPSPPGLFFRYICPLLTKAALCGAAAVIVALGRRSDVCFTLSFLRLALKFRREHQNSVLDKCSLCFSELWGLLRCQRGQCCLCFSGANGSPGLQGTHTLWMLTHTHTHAQNPSELTLTLAFVF